MVDIEGSSSRSVGFDRGEFGHDTHVRRMTLVSCMRQSNKHIYALLARPDPPNAFPDSSCPRTFARVWPADARASRSRTFSATTPRLFRQGNPLFRSGDILIGSFWRSNVFAGNATFDDENDVEEDAAGTGTRAVERAVNGTSAVTAAATGGHAAAAVADMEGNGRVAGGNSLDSTERGEGGDGGGQGRILFYHKPTLANVPAGDIPDVVPVYLGCPRGNMALGLPLDEAWQGEEHQVRSIMHRSGGKGGLRLNVIALLPCDFSLLRDQLTHAGSFATDVCRKKC